jgi:general secretion pathway protein N
VVGHRADRGSRRGRRICPENRHRKKYRLASSGRILNCEIRLDQAEKPILITVSWSRIEVSDADLGLPATALGLAVPKLAPLGLGGEVTVHVAHLSIGNKGMKGNATLLWHGAGSVLSSVSPLGDYELRLEDEGVSGRASLRTLQGPLQLDGQGSWADGAAPVFLISARIAPQQVQQLSPLLRLIAIEQGEGRFELQLK